MLNHENLHGSLLSFLVSEFLPVNPLLVGDGSLLLLLPLLELLLVVGDDLYLLVQGLGGFCQIIDLAGSVVPGVAVVLDPGEVAIGDQVGGVIELHACGVGVEDVADAELGVLLVVADPDVGALVVVGAQGGNVKGLLAEAFLLVEQQGVGRTGSLDHLLFVINPVDAACPHHHPPQGISLLLLLQYPLGMKLLPRLLPLQSTPRSCSGGCCFLN